ncbi:hypothetical protein MUP32_01490 [Candidatus Microgenomates bacterium]|nr:hypothetical protein [Candidatus Microgenomates bacterium]
MSKESHASYTPIQFEIRPRELVYDMAIPPLANAQRLYSATRGERDAFLACATPAQMDLIFQSWPKGDKKSKKLFAECAPFLPIDSPDEAVRKAIFTYINTALDQVNPDSTLKTRLATVALRAAHIETEYLDPDHGRIIYRANSGDDFETKVIAKAVNQIAEFDHSIPEISADFSEDDHVVVPAIARALELAYIKDESLKESRRLFNNVRKYAAQAARNKNKNNLSRFWGWMKQIVGNGDLHLQNVVIDEWTHHAGVKLCPKVAYPDVPSLPPVVLNINDAATASFELLTRKEAPGVKNNLSEFLRAVAKANIILFNNILQTTIQRKDFAKEAVFGDFAGDFLRMIHQACDAKEPYNLDQLLAALRQPRKIHAGFTFYGQTPDTPPAYMIVVTPGATDSEPQKILMGRLLDENGLKMPTLALDESFRSSDYLGMFLDADPKQARDLTQARSELVSIHERTPYQADLPAIRRYFMALEEQLVDQEISAEDLEMVKLLARQIGLSDPHPLYIPILVALSHLASSSQRGVAPKPEIVEIDDFLEAAFSKALELDHGRQYIIASVKRYNGLNLKSELIFNMSDALNQWLNELESEIRALDTFSIPAERLVFYAYILEACRILSRNTNLKFNQDLEYEFNRRHQDYLNHSIKARDMLARELTERGLRLSGADAKQAAAYMDFGAISAIVEGWASLQEDRKQSISYLSINGMLADFWKNFGEHLGTGGRFNYVVNNLIPLARENRDAQLFLHLLLIHAQPEYRTRLLEEIFTRFEGLPNPLNIINRADLVALLGPNCFLAYDGTRLAAVQAGDPIPEIAFNFPLPFHPDMKVLLEAEIIGDLDDHPLLPTPVRAERAIRRNLRADTGIGDWIREIDKTDTTLQILYYRSRSLPAKIEGLREPAKFALWDQKHRKARKTDQSWVQFYKVPEESKNETDMRCTVVFMDGISGEFDITWDGLRGVTNKDTAIITRLKEASSPEEDILDNLEKAVYLHLYREVIDPQKLVDHLIAECFAKDSDTILKAEHQYDVADGDEYPIEDLLANLRREMDQQMKEGEMVIEGLISGETYLVVVRKGEPWKKWQEAVTPDNVRQIMEEKRVSTLMIVRDIYPDRYFGDLSKHLGKHRKPAKRGGKKVEAQRVFLPTGSKPSPRSYLRAIRADIRLLYVVCLVRQTDPDIQEINGVKAEEGFFAYTRYTTFRSAHETGREQSVQVFP